LTFDDIIDKYPGLFTDYEGSHCPDGWLPLVDEFCGRLVVEHPGVQINQLKEKFAELRVYVTDYICADLIEETVERSRHICQACGNLNAEIRDGFYWMVTLCDSCTETHGGVKR